MSKESLVCTSCGHIGRGRKVVKGFFSAEVTLYLFAILAWFIINPIVGFGVFLVGLAYSFYRIVSKKIACEKCGNATLIPKDTPMGKKLAGETASQEKISE